ncbi:probable acyl- dehydrogenase 6 [Pelobates cultripes]|uniref:Probable acyl- dehydrogenase 6 n=1 Tax=Pelobates cultripes TaxID=61616 RepID=A0AAD1RWX3_PELCU|nr:probable acyl- dehydrogenase 6 [Pelobates cultripes]
MAEGPSGERDLELPAPTSAARPLVLVHSRAALPPDRSRLAVHCAPLAEYGGSGLDFSYSIAVAEELGNINCGGVPMSIGVQSSMATPALARFGSDELKRQFLAPTTAGDVVACLGVSEAGAGSDVANIKTSAVKKGDDYVINGSKMWITNGCQADWMCLLTNTSAGPPHKNKSLICLPMKTPGVHITKKIKKIGMKSSDTAQIFFEDVRVPSKYLIGEEGMGFIYQMLQFQEERMWGVASVLSTMENIIQETVNYTSQRKIFNQPLLNNQVVHFRLAELATEVELLRSMLYRTVGLYVEGNDVTKLASMAKLKVGRLVRELSDSCLQYWGGMGFTDEVLVSRFYRLFNFKLLNTNKCWRKCGQVAHFIISFGHVQNSHNTGSLSPIMCLLKKLPDALPKATEIILRHILISATSVIPRYWKSDTIPSMTEVINNILEIKRCELAFRAPSYTLETLRYEWGLWEWDVRKRYSL